MDAGKRLTFGGYHAALVTGPTTTVTYVSVASYIASPGHMSFAYVESPTLPKFTRANLVGSPRRGTFPCMSSLPSITTMRSCDICFARLCISKRPSSIFGGRTLTQFLAASLCSSKCAFVIAATAYVQLGSESTWYVDCSRWARWGWHLETCNGVTIPRPVCFEGPVNSLAHRARCLSAKV